RAYVAGRVPGLYRGNAPHQSLVCDVDEPLRPAADLTHGVHAARIAIPAVDNKSDVDIHDVALAERLGTGNAVAHHVVYGGADRLREAAIVQSCRDCAVIHGKLEDELIELLGGHTRLYVRDQQIKRRGGELCGLMHGSKIFGPVEP